MTRRPGVRVAGAVAAIALVVAGVGASAALGMSNAKGEKLGDPVTNAGVTLQPPSGWTVEQVPNPVALVIAANAADVGVEAPGGPRLTAVPVAAPAASGEQLIADLDRSPLLGTPKTFKTKVGGVRAAGIEWTTKTNGTALTTRLIIVSLGDGRAYTFVIEAPQKQFKRTRATLDAILGTAEFDVAEVPAAPNPA